MYVNSCNSLPLSNQIYHIITWASKQACHLGYKTCIYSLNSIFQTGAFYLILRSIDSQYFDQSQPDQQYLQIQELYQVIETYLIKQCGQRITVSFRNKILIQGLNQELLKLLLFCCLHSQKKDEYIERVFQLDEIIQSTLMKAIQQVASNIMNIIDQNQILSRVQMLQNEAQILKSEIGICNQKEQSSQKLIHQLDEQVKKKNKQIKAYKLQKQKVIQVLQLTNLEDYLSSFQRLQQQNKILNRYVQQLQENNNELEQNQKQLRKQIKNQANVICDLNDDVTALKQKLCSLKLQNSFRNSFDTCDASRRSFGTEILTNDKQNLISSLKDQRRSLNFDKYRQANQQKKANPKQQELIQEMAQLRKYNVDLIQKLQNAYKTLNNLNLQSSEVRQKNQVLQKQNRFYKKQIGTLRKLHQKMENDLISGLI